MTAVAGASAPAVAPSRFETFRVTPWVHHCGRFVARNPRLWIRLGNAETRIRAADIEGIDIVKPVFVCGLARAGTTILLETLARHPQLGSHRYRDDPFLFTPLFWNGFLARLPDDPSDRLPCADPTPGRNRGRQTKLADLGIEQGLRTADIHTDGCKKVGTAVMGDAVVAALHA